MDKFQAKRHIKIVSIVYKFLLNPFNSPLLYVSAAAAAIIMHILSSNELKPQTRENRTARGNEKIETMRKREKVWLD